MAFNFFIKSLAPQFNFKDEIMGIIAMCTHALHANIYSIYSFFHFVFIRIASAYVGEHSLEPLFKSMEGNMISLNDKLLFLAIFLEYKNSISEQTEQKIRDIEKEINNNSIAFNTLRNLVFNFMYINDVPSKQRQSLCSLLKISNEYEQKLLRGKAK